MKKKLLISDEDAISFLRLSDSDAGQLIKGLCSYVYGIGGAPSAYLNKEYVKVIFSLMRREIDRAYKRAKKKKYIIAQAAKDSAGK